MIVLGATSTFRCAPLSSTRYESRNARCILLDETGQVRVTDFGLAKKIDADSGLTASGQVMGTPSYMPPEQAAGRTDGVGPLVDVYALGAT